MEDDNENPFNFGDDLYEDDDKEVLRKRKREENKRKAKLEEEEEKKRKILQHGGGRIFVGGTRRRIGHAKPLETFKQCPIISRGPREWRNLSPFFLGNIKIKELKCRRFENLWQFSKVFEKVSTQNQKKWKYPEERHAKLKKGAKKDEHGNYSFDDWEILPAFYKWREVGFGLDLAIRRPNGSVRKNGKPLFSLHPETNERMSYITSRKKLYGPFYENLVRKRKEYKKLIKMLKDGENILLIDVDGPDVEKYPNGREMNKKLLKELINDRSQIYGHGYACANALLDDLGREE